MNISITEIKSSRANDIVGISVADILGDDEEGEEDPYHLFAKKAENDLLSAVRTKFCSEETSNLPIKVNITFLKMRMAAQEPYHARFTKLLGMLHSSYADVEIDKKQRKINATIIWNPRRMLRDQLILMEGYTFADTEPLAPFSQSEFTGFMRKYAEKVLWGGALGDGDMRISELKGTMPDDMYGLFVHSGLTTRVPFGGVVGRGVRRLIAASHVGYSAIVKLVIDRAFEENFSPPINSISEIKRTDIENLYRSTKWSLHHATK